MKIIPSEDPKKIIKANRKLEKELAVKVMVTDKEISVKGNPEDEYIAEKVIEALGFGFSLDKALLIKKEDFLFEVLNIKDHTHRNDLKRIRARIIGKKGGTLRTLSSLTECNLEIKNNEVGIIGSPECIKNAQDAIILIIHGSKQANVYAFLEKHQVQPVFDLGLKEQKRNKKRNKE